jgi:H+-translocating NAD(P) transhydrogenase subunit beta
MPVLRVSDARKVIVLKRGRGKGYSGVENDLFFDPKTSMLVGDAHESLVDLIREGKTA